MTFVATFALGGLVVGGGGEILGGWRRKERKGVVSDWLVDSLIA